jgi:hypothetical protein
MTKTIDFTQHTGYPTKLGYPHYGLYQPLLGHFLLITNSLDESIKIKNLAISRYSLFIFQLDDASNYSFNLIDNDCCENWSVIPHQRFDFAVTYYSDPIKAQQLIAASTNNININIAEEKQWLQYIWYWIRFVDWIAEAQSWYHQKKFMIDLGLYQFPDYQLQLQQLQQHQQFFYKTLLLEQNISTANNKIIEYLQNNQSLADLYQQWKSGEA